MEMLKLADTDYSGNFLYENNELKAIFTSAGRIIPCNGMPEEMQVKTHI